MADAPRVVVSAPEVAGARKNPVRFHKAMWEGVALEQFDFRQTGEGPFGLSYDLLGDGSIRLVSIPGHTDGLYAVKVVGSDGKFVLLFSDGGYSARSWREMVRPGISVDVPQQEASLEWIRQQSLDPDCVESCANHDPAIEPHVVTLSV